MSDDHPRYPNLNQDIIERVFPELEEIVHAESWESVFDDLEHRAPRLRSNHPAHPKTVTYAFKLAPVTGLNMLDGNVSVKIGVDEGDYSSPADLRRNVPTFREEGFNVELEGTRDTYEIVWDSWAIEPDALEDEETLQEVANRFSDLVRVGHQVLAE